MHRRDHRFDSSLTRVRAVADYQFGKKVGTRFLPKHVKIGYSERTGRIRYVHLDGVRLVTLRPTDGLFSLSINGAKRLLSRCRKSLVCIVSVRNDVSDFMKKGGDVFAAHVVDASDEIRAKDEVIVIDENNQLLAVGRAVLSGDEMRAFKRGVAVKIRRGCADEA